MPTHRDRLPTPRALARLLRRGLPVALAALAACADDDPAGPALTPSSALAGSNELAAEVRRPDRRPRHHPAGSAGPGPPRAGPARPGARLRQDPERQPRHLLHDLPPAARSAPATAAACRSARAPPGWGRAASIPTAPSSRGTPRRSSTSSRCSRSSGTAGSVGTRPAPSTRRPDTRLTPGMTPGRSSSAPSRRCRSSRCSRARRCGPTRGNELAAVQRRPEPDQVWAG